MKNYGWTLEYVMELTRNQLVLFKEQIEERMLEERSFTAMLHDKKLKGKGLDLSGAIPIESVLESQKKF